MKPPKYLYSTAHSFLETPGNARATDTALLQIHFYNIPAWKLGRIMV